MPAAVRYNGPVMFEFLFFITIGLLSGASVLCICSLHADRDRQYRWARLLFYLSAGFFLASGLVRYYPFGLRDFISIVSTIWGHLYILALFLILMLAYIDFFRWRRHWRSVASVAMPFITVVCVLSLPFIGSGRMMQVGFANHLLPFHVILAVVGELFFFFSFAGSLLWLFAERGLKRKYSFRIIKSLPSLESIESFIGWSVSRAAAFLSLGILTGVSLIWVNFRTVSLFSVKEIVIYASWMFIIIIVGLRKDGRMGIGKLNILIVLLFTAVFAMFVVSNLIITSGFHSFE